MRPSDILNRAAEIIIERGHHKGDYVDDETGRVCTLGAVNTAVTGSPDLWLERANEILCVTPYIELVIDTPHVGGWNDRPETTEAMAIGALHEAALLAKEAGE